MRTWKAPTTSCLLLLAAPFLADLGLGDSPLVIFSPCSLVLSFVISIFFVFFNSLSIIFDLPYAFWHEVAFCLYIFITYQKKKEKKKKKTAILANQQSINLFWHINNFPLPCKSPSYLLLLFFQRAKSSFGKTCHIFPVLKNSFFFFFLDEEISSEKS